MFTGNQQRKTERKMTALSSQLLHGVHALARDGESIFDTLERVLNAIRPRPVIVRNVAFPPHTASGMWVALDDMDILAIREDAVDDEHRLVILGHEVWHMMEGHCSAHAPAGQAATRAQSAASVDMDELMGLVIQAVGRTPGVISPRVFDHAARTDFVLEAEAEAETFGLKLATSLRDWSRTRHRPDVHQVAGRIEASLRRGPWA
ncbi:toxin-antitoxin system, toxin component [Streptomyces sp. Tue6028]|uniref:toxin-antitoxin system, toxin component n=1 Tax=Streptomyces sp. Tue6028 TaxID=2036037 RepID=UPI003D70331E